MIVAGIDIGSLTAKAVILELKGEEKKILSQYLIPTGADSAAAANKVMEATLKEAGLAIDDVGYVITTGSGKNECDYANETATEIICDVRGVLFYYSEGRTIIDIGAESCRVIKCNGGGKVKDFALNDKCAAGTGVFLDTMAKALEVERDKMGKLSQQSKEGIKITSMCVVFSESEVVSLIHRKVKKTEILGAIHRSIASRVYGMINRIGIEKEVVMIGGVALNNGVISALEDLIELKIKVTEKPQFIGALGAALVGGDKKK